jgi:hypothetical protein
LARRAVSEAILVKNLSTGRESVWIILRAANRAKREKPLPILSLLVLLGCE